VTHPIPPGTRDVLPDEARELRVLSDRLRATFEQAGYGEVLTPTVEYEEVLRLGDERAAGAGFRLFDDHGRVLVLRSDMTIPIARVATTRFAGREGPLRLCYFGHAYRSVQRGSGQPTEFLQAGIELIGPEAPAGDGEVLMVVLRALEECGLRRHRVGIGDGSLFRRLLAEHGVPEAERDEVLACLARRDLVGLERRLPPELARIPMLRGGPEVLDGIDGVDGLRALHAELESEGLAERAIFDLGLVHELGYYTGAVFEVYDPAVGFALGGGGRYDALLGRFGEDRPACGVALDVQRVHVAQAEEERLG